MLNVGWMTEQSVNQFDKLPWNRETSFWTNDVMSERMLQMELHNTETTWELLYGKSKAKGSFHISPLKFECKGKAP